MLAEAGFALSDMDRLFEADDYTVPLLTKAGCRPASTLLGVANLAFHELLVQLEATAVA